MTIFSPRVAWWWLGEASSYTLALVPTPLLVSLEGVFRRHLDAVHLPLQSIGHFPLGVTHFDADVEILDRGPEQVDRRAIGGNIGEPGHEHPPGLVGTLRSS